jgi:hypothetical protein
MKDTRDRKIGFLGSGKGVAIDRHLRTFDRLASQQYLPCGSQAERMHSK